MRNTAISGPRAVDHDLILKALLSDTDLRVMLEDDRVLPVTDVVWGQDIEEVGFHVTTNIFNPPKPGVLSDFFWTGEVMEIWKDERRLYPSLEWKVATTPKPEAEK